MPKFKYLLRNSLKHYFSLSSDPKQRKKQIASYVVLAVVMLPLIIAVCAVLYSVTGEIKAAGMLDSLLASIMLAAQIMVLFFGVVTFLAVMYFSKDNEFLLSLPVKPVEIYLTKLLMVYLSHFAISTLILLPVFITTAIAAQITTVSYYIFAILGIFLVPMMPLLLVSIIALPLAYIVNYFRKNATLATIVGMVVFIGLFAAYFVGIMSIQNSIPTDDGTINIDGMKNVLRVMSLISYPGLMLSRAMLGIGNVAANASIFFGIVIGAAIISIGLSVLLYRKSATKFLEVGVKKGKAKQMKVSGSQLWTLIKRDLKSLTRDTSLAFNSFMGILLSPIVIGIMCSSMGSAMGSVEGNSTMNAEIMNIATASLMAIIMLISTNYIAMLPISREGDKFYMIKYMPITPKTYIKSKLLLADIYVVVGSVLSSIGLFVTGVKVYNGIAFIICIACYGLGMNGFMVNRDIKNPNLHWINIREITKRNYSIMPTMIIDIVAGLVLMFAGVMLGILGAKIGDWCYLIYWGIVLLLSLAVYILFRKRLYDKLEMNFENIEAHNG